jgi:DNA-binding protein HU-beta
MHKTDLINEIANITGSSKKDAGSALEATLQSISSALKGGNSVTLIGFGTFKTINTAARKGRNPQTGKEIQIPASTRVKFSAGKALKDTVNN